MKKIIGLLVLMLMFSGCGSYETEEKSVEAPVSENIAQEDEAEEVKEDAKYRKISAEEAKELMVDGNMVLDVRTQGEYDSGHIENAVLLPVDDILDGKLSSLPDKEQVILVYCRSGRRSKSASKELVEQGYINVYDFGGIIDWPYEIVE